MLVVAKLLKINEGANGTAIALYRVPVMYRLTGKSSQSMIEAPG